MNVKYDFSGKTVLVVGAGTGMGKSTALLMADAGANVVVADFNEELGNEVVAEITSKGGNATFVYCDVRDKESAKNAVTATVNAYGRIDYAANVVGITGDARRMNLYERSDEDFANVMDTNVTGHWWLLKAETEQMTKQGGEGYAIVEVVSIQGLVANAMGLHAYTTSKHAAMGLVKSVGIEFASKGIRINGIAPVATATDLAKKAYAKMGMEWTNKTDRVPRGTMLEPEECAHAIAWLLSDGASAMYATTIAVDGGATAFK